jgi:hypothetical protein
MFGKFITLWTLNFKEDIITLDYRLHCLSKNIETIWPLCLISTTDFQHNFFINFPRYEINQILQINFLSPIKNTWNRLFKELQIFQSIFKKSPRAPENSQIKSAKRKSSINIWLIDFGSEVCVESPHVIIKFVIVQFDIQCCANELCMNN